MNRVKQMMSFSIGVVGALLLNYVGESIYSIAIGKKYSVSDLITLLFTSKWLLAVPIMQYACLYYLATPYLLINVQVFLALGYSQIRIKIEAV